MQYKISYFLYTFAFIRLYATKTKSLSQMNTLKKIAFFYIDGFRNMTVGRSLWLIVIIKLFIMFAILKLFFFPDILATQYDNDADRAQHVRNELLKNR